jgi:Zn-dependent protease/predicted transcriptional regulator
VQGGFRIGRIFGINIRIDWSWILIFLLISWNMSAVFGGLNPDWGVVTRWSVAIVAALLFFISVLLHELAHSLVARARGMPVRNITLFLFGGVSNIQREPPTPGKEFWMAIVGPLTSIVLGFLLLVGLSMFSPMPTSMANAEELMSSLGPISMIVLWLGTVNIFLGAFNLIPGFPLDGGRILRSILWSLSDDLRQATQWASWVGQGIAWLMIFAGTAMIFGVSIPIFGTGLTNGLWLILIGWFLNSAAGQSYRRVLINEALEDVPIANIMRKDFGSVSSDCSISSLVHDHIMGSDERAYPVVENDELVGIVTLDDIRSVSRSDWDKVTVREVMTPTSDLVTVGPQVDAAQAFNKLMQRDVSQLPVVRGKELLGMLRRRDIVRWLQLQSDAGLS